MKKKSLRTAMFLGMQNLNNKSLNLFYSENRFNL